MDKKQFEKLECGDIVKHIIGDKSIIVMANYGSRVTAVRTYDLTNPDEWELVMKANYKREI